MSTNNSTTNEPRANYSWRVIDIIIASVLGVAIGLIFWVWNSIGGAWYEAANALTPGLGGIAVGIWLIGGVVGGLVIRKPGAALYVELIAATVSATIGNQWGISTLYSGLAQGLGAELIFALFLYRRFGIQIAALAGIGAGLGAFLLELVLSANIAKSLLFNITYLVSMSVSGAILAGVLGYFLVQALAATGALDRFAVGRQSRDLV
ncbi:putative membrane protein [Corynebacterium mustelae]|uniref:Putative membrane protein n=1 Tax=Corynebacterium mustelae TaxID=571915 RepID=A0A0G3GWD7_9CORY|nr:ECF transporter S component [Corynebacterium mustelae]AKK05496.1 putative membrane protein [Corynebacterium mustelae]